MSHKLYIFILAAVLFAACRSSKNATGSSVLTAPQATTEVTDALPNSAQSLTDQTNLTARVRVKLKFDGNDVGTNGTLRMRIGEVIQVSLLDPILGISEVGRLEIDPTSILAIDRYNKRYIVLTYDDINRYSSRQLDYQTIEYHFWQQALRDDTEELQFQVPLGKKNVELTLRLSNKNNKSDWEAHTVPSLKYDQVSADEFFKSLSDF